MQVWLRNSLVYLLLIFIIQEECFSQILINEVSSRNSSIIHDDEESYEDWIELYNAGNNYFNLKGLSIGDDNSHAGAWKFPAIDMKPGSYLLLFASGKDRRHKIDWGASDAHAEEKWKYLVSTGFLSDEWVEIEYHGTEWTIASMSEGLNDGDNVPIFTPPGNYVYMRKRFVVFDLRLINEVVLSYDPHFEYAFFVNERQIEVDEKNEGNFDLEPYLIPGINVVALRVKNTADFNEIHTPDIHVEADSDSDVDEDLQLQHYLHTDFELSKNGESVYLFDASGEIMDSIKYPYLQLDHSYGRFPDGSSRFSLFPFPTPNNKNYVDRSYQNYLADVPAFSLKSGFYDTPQKLCLTTSNAGNYIRFTTDGTMPTEEALLYEDSIEITVTTVVKARSFNELDLPGEVMTQSYFIGENTFLPVISMSTDPRNLWDPEYGIYASSGNIDPFDNADVEANYWKNWERPVVIEYFNTAGKAQFIQEFGAKIHGAASRKYPQKSFRILAKGKYGESKLEYPLFPDKPVKEYKRFVLRISGNEWNQTHFRDAFASRAVQNVTFNDVQAYQPAVLFINGKYWGVYNIREKVGRFYIEENYNVDDDKIDLLEKNHLLIGSRLHFDKMLYFAESRDMSREENYVKIAEMLDIENFCDYFITQLFFDNSDWPQNNLKLWRKHDDSGKWKYILYDLDISMGFKGDIDYEDAHIRLPVSNSVHVDLFYALIENAKFKEYFITRYLDLLNTVFSPSRLTTLINEIKATLKPEMPRHHEKWGGSMEEWEEYIEELTAFIENRPSQCLLHIAEMFDLQNERMLNINLSSEGAGQVEINTVKVDKFPWSGTYFDKQLITIKATPKPGYEFSYWKKEGSLLNNDPEPSLNFYMDANTRYTAIFIPSNTK